MGSPDRSLIDASIIICTHNRAARLNETLSSLASMSIDADCSFEVIIVDNRSEDYTSQIVTNWADRLPIVYIYELRLGLSHARNRGVAASRGRFILFTDDDCIVDFDWLGTGMRLLSGAPLQIIGGRVELFNTADRPLTIKVETVPASLASVGDLLGFLHGCNMIFGRPVMDAVGLFDPKLGAGTLCKAAEDADFVYRALKLGIPVHYRPELCLAHNHGRKRMADEEKLNDGYIQSLGALALKYLFRGDTSLLRLAYWGLRSEAQQKRNTRILSYIKGSMGYAYLSFMRRGARCRNL